MESKKVFKKEVFLFIDDIPTIIGFTKPIGKLYSKELADKLFSEKGVLQTQISFKIPIRTIERYERLQKLLEAFNNLLLDKKRYKKYIWS